MDARMARLPLLLNIPPPRRASYGPVANNPEGDENFRDARGRWYEDVTGDSIEGLDVSAQW